MTLYDNGDMEEFLLFQQNNQTVLESSDSITKVSKIYYLRTLFHGQTLHEFKVLYEQINDSNIKI